MSSDGRSLVIFLVRNWTIEQQTLAVYFLKGHKLLDHNPATSKWRIRETRTKNNSFSVYLRFSIHKTSCNKRTAIFCYAHLTTCDCVSPYTNAKASGSHKIESRKSVQSLSSGR